MNGDGVSDHYTILFKVAGGDTLYPVNQGTGMEMFTAGNRPENYWQHVVGDTTYAVIPRSMSTMWDGDGPGSSIDDSGEQDLDYPCVGFIGWRLLDCYLKKADGTIERPIDVHGVPIPSATAGGTGRATRAPTSRDTTTCGEYSRMKAASSVAPPTSRAGWATPTPLKPG